MVVSISDDVAEDVIFNNSIISPPPSEFLPDDTKINLILYTAKKGVDTPEKRWNRSTDIWSIFTDDNLYIVSSSPQSEFIKISYDKVSNVKSKSPILRRHREIEIDANSEKYIIYTKKHNRDELINRAIDLLSSDRGDGEIIDGSVEELYLEKIGGEAIESLDVKTYHHEDGFAPELPDEEQRIVLTESELTFEEADVSIPVSEIATVLKHSEEYSGQVQRVAEEGIEIITRDEIHLYFYRRNAAGEMKHKDGTMKKVPVNGIETPDFPTDLYESLISKVSKNNVKRDSIYTLIGPFTARSYKVGSLKIEEWTDGAQKVSGSLSAESQSAGKSKGIQLGPFTRSKTKSESTISGDLSARISDNSFSSDIDCAKIFKDKIIVDSSIFLDISFDNISEVHEMNKEIAIQAGQNTFRISYSRSSFDGDKADEIVEYIQNHLTNEDNETVSDDGTGDKLRELKELHEEGILTDEEFESKKEDLLDEF